MITITARQNRKGALLPRRFSTGNDPNSPSRRPGYPSCRSISAAQLQFRVSRMADRAWRLIGRLPNKHSTRLAHELRAVGRHVGKLGSRI